MCVLGLYLNQNQKMLKRILQLYLFESDRKLLKPRRNNCGENYNMIHQTIDLQTETGWYIKYAAI